jgi:ankyrin repeat protein
MAPNKKEMNWENSPIRQLIDDNKIDPKEKQAQLKKLIEKGESVAIASDEHPSLIHYLIDEKNFRGKGGTMVLMEILLKADPSLQDRLDAENMNAICKVVRDLSYLDDKEKQEQALYTVKLLLDHGADPNSKLYGEGQSLFEEAREQRNPELINLLLNNKNLNLESAYLIKLFDEKETLPISKKDIQQYFKRNSIFDIRRKFVLEVGLENKTLKDITDVLGDNWPRYFTREFLEDVRENIQNQKIVVSINKFITEADTLKSTHKTKELEEMWPNYQNEDGNTFLHSAMYRTKEELELLLKAGADPNIPESNKLGWTPLYQAIAGNNKEIAELLLKNGADPNIHKSNKIDCTPLYQAIAGNNKEIAELLLKNGADPNIPESSRLGWTPLQKAIVGDKKEIVEILLKNGADPSLKDRFGDDSFKCAKNNEQLSQLLKDYSNKQKRAEDKVEGNNIEIVKDIKDNKGLTLDDTIPKSVKEKAQETEEKYDPVSLKEAKNKIEGKIIKALKGEKTSKSLPQDNEFKKTIMDKSKEIEKNHSSTFAKLRNAFDIIVTGEETSKEVDYRQAAKDIIKEQKLKETDGYKDLVKKKIDKSKGGDKGR